MPDKCRSCGAAVRFVPSVKSGKLMILDAEPHPDGNIAVIPAGAMVLPKDLFEQGKAIGSKRYRDHHATCPQANSWRKSKVKEP